jgi:hypothetical protein
MADTEGNEPPLNGGRQGRVQGRRGGRPDLAANPAKLRPPAIGHPSGFARALPRPIGRRLAVASCIFF